MLATSREACRAREEAVPQVDAWLGHTRVERRDIQFLPCEFPARSLVLPRLWARHVLDYPLNVDVPPSLRGGSFWGAMDVGAEATTATVPGEVAEAEPGRGRAGDLWVMVKGSQASGDAYRTRYPRYGVSDQMMGPAAG